MQEPKTWREFLRKVIEDPREKGRLADLLGVNERTLDRWATGLSRPRSSAHVRQLLKAFPDQRAVLGTLMRGEFPEAVEQTADENDIFIDEVIRDVPVPFYKRVLETYAMAVEPVRSWTICNLVLQQLSQHLDIDHQGIRVLLMQCVHGDGQPRVRSLHLLFEHTSGQMVAENWPLFYGIESLAGLAVMRGVPQIKQTLHGPEIATHDLWRFPLRSAAAYPIQRAGRCAGSLLVLSSYPSFFTQARLVLLQHYVHLLTLGFGEQDFYSPADINLQIMPAESTQQHVLDAFQERVLTFFCQARERGEDLTWTQAEQAVSCEIESALGQLTQRAPLEKP